MTQSVKLLRRGEAGFDAAVLGTSFSAQDPGRRPDAYVRAENARDVAAAVQRAGMEGWRVSTCSGGHAWNQNHIRDGGLLIDLSRLNNIDIRAKRRIAVVGTGCVGGDLDAELRKLDLFFPVAHAYTVGLGGFLLAGGFGWNCRVSGVGCQNVVGVDVVLADGTIVHASETENSEILWAARGSGPGFFGIVVAFHLKLHDRPKYIGLKVQVFRERHLEEVFAWADRIAASVSPKVEFQIIINKKAFGIFSHGLEVVCPVLADSKAEAKELIRFITDSPIRKKASFTLPLMRVSLTWIMKIAEKVVFPPGIRWSTDNLWLGGSLAPVIPAMRKLADTQPAAPAHSLWMNWNPASRERPDMAFSMEGQSYLAVYGGIKGDARHAADETWAQESVLRMAEHGIGIQLNDENLGRRKADFMSPANLQRLDALRERFDPALRFHSYGRD